MKKNLRWKTLLILLLTSVALWQLHYTWRLHRLTPEDKRNMTEEELARLHDKAIHLGLDLQGGMHLVLQVDHSALSEEEAKDATDRALEILRNRIDQFGVYEPSIEKQGGDRIIIQLPGVVDRERAKALIGKTALLEFKIVEEPERTNQIFQEIDEALHKIEVEASGEDTLNLAPNPFLSFLFNFGGDLVANNRDKSEVEKILSSEETKGIIPKDLEISWGNEVVVEGFRYRPLYLLKKKAELTGAAIQDARAGIGTNDNPNGVKVDLTMAREARSLWAAITGANVNRRLAIVLDNTVYSAPIIRERIRGGVSQIDMGNSSISEAKDLAIVLRAGALPAPVVLIEERSVGPSLGKDSIEKGIRSVLWGGALVLLFMLIYYNLSGAVAIVALLLNLIFLFAILSAFRATLTLPGIAGIILTIGIAVDANVLIFERIREEIRSGKTLRTAIDTGYTLAFRTILDSNVTTLLTALILYWFGTGPIRGFAVTLSIGIICSFFTAIVFTRLVFDFATSRLNVKNLRI